MPRPLMLVPSSKAKTTDGDGPPYAVSTTTTEGPLATARAEVLATLQQAAVDLDDAGIARLCGVKPAEVAEQRTRLAGLADAATLPALQRYTGVVHRFAGLADRTPSRLGADVAVVGGLLGVALHDEPVPDYRLEVTGRLAGLGVLGTWWARRLGAPLRQLAGSRRVWDLLPGEHARLWPAREREDAEVVTVRFERADGRAAPSATAKVAKGGLLRLLLSEPGLGPDDLAGDPALPGWQVERRDAGLAFVQDT